MELDRIKYSGREFNDYDDKKVEYGELVPTTTFNEEYLKKKV